MSDRLALIVAARSQECRCEGPGRCVHQAMEAPAIPQRVEWPQHERHAPAHFGSGLAPVFHLGMQLGYAEMILQADANGVSEAWRRLLSDGQWHSYLDLAGKHRMDYLGGLWALELDESITLEHDERTNGPRVHVVRLRPDSPQPCDIQTALDI